MYRVFLIILLSLTITIDAEIIFNNGSNALSIPFQNINEKMYMEITINDLLLKEVMFDTGMSMRGILLMDPADGRSLDLVYQTSYELGGAGRDEGPVIANVSMDNYFSVPGVRVTDQVVLVMSERRDQVDNWPVDAILGISFFDQIVEIDFDSQEINLFDREHFDGSSYPDTLIINEFPSGIPAVNIDVSINGEPARTIEVIVDTGCEFPTLYDFSPAAIPAPDKISRTVDGLIAEGLSGEMTGKFGRISKVRITEHDFDNVITMYPDQECWENAAIIGKEGILGLSVLSRFNVAFDYTRKYLLLKPNSSYETKFEFENFGAVTQYDKEKNIEIIDVFIGSPAQSAGLIRGDVILAIEGRLLPEISYAEYTKIIKQDDVEIEMEIRREDKKLRKKVQLREFL